MHPLTPVWDVLMYVVLPLWVIAGFVDYLCHRATDIEHANGIRESLLHWLMLGEVGVPIIAAIFLKVNAFLIGFFVLCLIAHEITGHIDLRVAMRTRKVSAFEQQVHSVLEIMPLTAFLLLCILHWPQAVALLGLGPEKADSSLEFKQAPLWDALIPPFAAFGLLAILPYVEELWRCFRAEARKTVAEPPDCP